MRQSACLVVKEKKKEKTRNRYNQVPQLTGDPYGKVTKHKETSDTRETRGLSFPSTRLQGTDKTVK